MSGSGSFFTVLFQVWIGFGFHSFFEAVLIELLKFGLN